MAPLIYEKKSQSFNTTNLAFVSCLPPDRPSYCTFSFAPTTRRYPARKSAASMPLLEHQCFSDFVLLLRERPSRHPLPAWRTPTHASAPGSKATSSPWLSLGSRVPCSPSASSRRTGHSRRCVSPLQHLSLMLEVLFIVVFPTKLGYGRVRILAPKLLFPKYF